MEPVAISSLIAAAALAVIHFFGGRLRFLDKAPRSRWLSFGGGVSVAYVLLHLLPELEQYGQTFAQSGAGDWRDRLIFVVTLGGLVAFYGLEKLALNAGDRGRAADQGQPVGKTERQQSRNQQGQQHRDSPQGIFWAHIGAFAAYNALIGYLLVYEDRDLANLALFAVAIGVHFVINDWSLRAHHGSLYHRWGRWLLAAGILLGWLTGILFTIPDLVTAAVIGFLTGAILLNTFKEELPEERASRFWAFGLGALGYAALMLAV